MKKLLFALSLVVFITAQSFTVPSGDNELGYEIGDVVQDFSLKNVDGEMMSLGDSEDAKGYIVVFTCNHCPFSVMYEDRLIEFTFPYLHDSTQEIARQFGATRTPHIYVLVKEEADFVVKYIGAIDDSPRSADDVEDPYLHKAMRSIISGYNPDPNFTKAIGCTIKWAE